MITKEEIGGSWNEIRGKVKKEWGQISDDDLARTEGNIDEVIGLIQQKTGQARAEIENSLRRMSEETGYRFAEATATVQQYANQAVDQAKQQLGQAQGVIKRHPAESVIVCFGTGLLLGVVIGLVSRSR